jgi:uncharacterized membrane protein (GlpM family)
MISMLPWLKNYLIFFVTGGLFTVIIVALEESNLHLLSGFATLMPVFTVVAYIFIGETSGAKAVGQNAWFVLVGTIVSWVPYMILVAMLAPRIGTRYAIGIGLLGFFVLAAIYLLIVYHYHFWGE